MTPAGRTPGPAGRRSAFRDPDDRGRGRERDRPNHAEYADDTAYDGHTGEGRSTGDPGHRHRARHLDHAQHPDHARHPDHADLEYAGHDGHARGGERDDHGRRTRDAERGRPRGRNRDDHREHDRHHGRDDDGEPDGHAGPDRAGRPRSTGRRPRRPLSPTDQRRRGLRRLAVLVVGLLGGIGIGYLLLFSSVFGVARIDVVGTSLLTPDQVRAAAAVPAGTPLLRLDVGAVADRVRALPPVAGVEVQRSWPSGLTIRLTERVPLAFVPDPQGARLVDRDGVEFATVAAPPAGIPQVQAADPRALAAAAGVLATLAEPGHEALRAAVTSVGAESQFDVRLALAGDRTVRWGSADDSDRKAAVLIALLTQPGSTYDVAAPDLPTIS